MSWRICYWIFAFYVCRYTWSKNSNSPHKKSSQSVECFYWEHCMYYYPLALLSSSHAYRLHSVCIACFFRMFYLYDPQKPKVGRKFSRRITNWFTTGWHFELGSTTKSLYWGVIELGFAIICACLPFYAPLLSWIVKAGSRTWPSFFIRRKGSNRTYANMNNTNRFRPFGAGMKTAERTIDAANLTRDPVSTEESISSYSMEHLDTRNVKSTIEVVWFLSRACNRR